MATTTFLGYPPANVVAWINGDAPAPTPTPSTNNWTLNVFTYEDQNTPIVTSNLASDGSTTSWTGTFTVESQTSAIALEQTENGAGGYNWTISENSGESHQFINSSSITPNAIAPTQITTADETWGTYVYVMERSLA